MGSCEHITKGFQVTVLTDHKNNLFTSSLLANRRVNKKLLRWAIDLEELGSMVKRVWIKGSEHVLGDGLSRNPPDRDTCKRLAIPSGPVKRVIKAMFEKPLELDTEIAYMTQFLDTLDKQDPEKGADKPFKTSTQAPIQKSSPSPSTSRTSDGTTKPQEELVVSSRGSLEYSSSEVTPSKMSNDSTVVPGSSAGNVDVTSSRTLEADSRGRNAGSTEGPIRDGPTRRGRGMQCGVH